MHVTPASRTRWASASQWLVLAIVAEMPMSAHLGRDWYGLLGSPDHPLLRNVFLFVWVFARMLRA